VDPAIAAELTSSRSAGGPADDDEPADSTKIDEFRLGDLGTDKTSGTEKTDKRGARSPKDTM